VFGNLLELPHIVLYELMVDPATGPFAAPPDGFLAVQMSEPAPQRNFQRYFCSPMECALTSRTG